MDLVILSRSIDPGGWIMALTGRRIPSQDGTCSTDTRVDEYVLNKESRHPHISPA